MQRDPAPSSGSKVLVVALTAGLVLVGVVLSCLGSLTLLGGVLEVLGEVEPTPDGPASAIGASLLCCFAPAALAWVGAFALHRRSRAAASATTPPDLASTPEAQEPHGSEDVAAALAPPSSEEPEPETSGKPAAFRVTCVFCAFEEDRATEPGRREKCPQCRAPLTVKSRP